MEPNRSLTVTKSKWYRQIIMRARKRACVCMLVHRDACTHYVVPLRVSVIVYVRTFACIRLCACVCDCVGTVQHLGIGDTIFLAIGPSS
jgi:hypothetical protein